MEKEATGVIRKIYHIYANEHLPVGVRVKKGVADRAALNEWWTDRVIPMSRSDIENMLEALNITDTKGLLTRCYGLSLSDQYWVCPEGENLTWDKINFFANAFSNDIGDVLLGTSKKTGAFDFHSPDITTDGNLKKRWVIMDGKRYLIKGGSNPFLQQPFNELIATKIANRLGIPNVPYTIMWNQGEPYSVCVDFVTADTELIPAWRIIQTQKKDNSTSMYQHFVNCCESLGIKGVVSFLDCMIVLDYIIANEDRHLNNFGAIRNAETLEWLGMAPIYDSGTSLGYDMVAAQIYSESNVICKPFKKHHTEQLKLVSSFEWIDFEKLKDVKELIVESFPEEASGYIDEARVKAVCDTVEKRIQNLQHFANAYMSKQALSTKDDVEENIAQAYGTKKKIDFCWR